MDVNRAYIHIKYIRMFNSLSGVHTTGNNDYK